MPPAVVAALAQHHSTYHTLLSHLAEAWAYAALGASSILTEEFAPIVAGFAAHEGHLGLLRGWLAVVVGSWGAGVGLYALGRWRGSWVRKRWPRLRPHLTRALAFVRRHPWRASLLVRFAVGARIALPIACGAARLPWVTFLGASAISSALWSLLFVVLGWAFGDAALLVLGHVRRYDDYLVAAIAVALLVTFLILHRRAQERTARGLESPDRLPGDL